MLPPVQRVQGLPVLRTPDVLVDLAHRLSDHQLLDVLQEALRLRRCSEPELRAATGRGRAGSATIGRALDVVGDGADSRYERILVRRCAAARLPAPTRPLLYAPLSGHFWRPDLFWDGVVVEVDGFSAHCTGAAFLADRRRQNELVTELGLIVLRYTPIDIRDRPDQVVAQIAAVLRRRAA